MNGRELDRRTRVVFIAGWGSVLEQPGWARELGLRFNRATLSSLEAAFGVAAAGGSECGFPVYVQKYLLSPATPADPAVRLVVGSWRKDSSDAAWRPLTGEVHG
jgi:hypothetical protein